MSGKATAFRSKVIFLGCLVCRSRRVTVTRDKSDDERSRLRKRSSRRTTAERRKKGERARGLPLPGSGTSRLLILGDKVKDSLAWPTLKRTVRCKQCRSVCHSTPSNPAQP